MKIDILLPFHKIDRNFAAAIDSLKNSNHKSLNIILIDDRPYVDSDSNLDNLIGSDLEITYIRTTGLVGYGFALKSGTTKITSKYVALMNSDDLIHPARFSKQLESIEGFDLCFTKMAKINSNNHQIPAMMGTLKQPNYHPLFLLLGSYGADATWLMTAEWWQKNSFFDHELGLDWRIAMKSFFNSKIKYLDEVLYFYRRHESQSSKLDRTYRSYDSIYSTWKELCMSYDLKNTDRNLFDTLVLPDKTKSNLTRKQIIYHHNEILSLFDQKHESDLALDFSNLFKYKVLISRTFKIKSAKLDLRVFYWTRNQILPIILQLFKFISLNLFSRLMNFTFKKI